MRLPRTRCPAASEVHLKLRNGMEPGREEPDMTLLALFGASVCFWGCALGYWY